MSTNIVTINFKIYDAKLLYVFCECVGLMAAEYFCNLCALSHRKNVIHMFTISMRSGFSQN
jgi:hypothetical protein